MDTTNIKESNGFLKNPSLLIGIALAFLLPIFVIPMNTISFLVSKNIILFIGVFLLFLLWIIDRIKNKDFFVSKNLLVISAYLVPISYLLSALFSGSVVAGLMGYDFGVNTFAIIITLFMLMFFISKSFKTKKNILYVYAGLIFTAILMMIVHVLRLFIGPEFLSLGFLNFATANLIGNWNELGIFFGIIALISLIANEYLGKDKIVKIISLVLLVASLLFVWLINFTLVWVFLMIISFLLVIYNLFLNKNKEEVISYNKLYKKTSVYVFVIALLFVLLQGKIGGILPSFFDISNFEVRPTISSTLDIGKSTLSTNPILGAGPNNFVNQWVVYKPQGVNMTEFWNTDFVTGSSMLLSSLTTIGLLGFISWILFIVSIIYLGFKLLRTSRNNQLNHFTVLSLFSIVVYLILFLLFYIPGIVILGLTFLILGILFSLLKQERLVKIRRISLAYSKIKKGLLALIIILILCPYLFGSYLFSKKVIASVQFNEGLIAINIDQDFTSGYEHVVKATSSYPNDFYFRNLTDLNLMQMQNIFNQQDVAEEDLQKQFEAVFSASVGSAQRAIQLNMGNYLNWANLAKVYGSVVPLKIEGAYDSAFQAYVQANNLNPTNPLLILSLANLELANEDLEKAKEYIGMSIQMKNNYSDAYYLLAQLEFSEGNKETGFQVIETLASVTPNDPQVFLQLGTLNYEETDYEKALTFLERAVTLNPYYFEAKYLLGLTYNVMGETEKAIGQIQDLKILNPSDENIDVILENIKAGRDPFYGFQQQEQQQQQEQPAPSVIEPVEEIEEIEKEDEKGEIEEELTEENVETAKEELEIENIETE